MSAFIKIAVGQRTHSGGNLQYTVKTHHRPESPVKSENKFIEIALQAKLGKKEPGKTKALIKLEKKLENWLAQCSLAQILDWFDCIETTNVQTVMGSYRWSTESVARDKLFLKYLGVDTQ